MHHIKNYFLHSAGYSKVMPIDFDSDDEDDEADLSYDVLEESINTDDSDSEADDLRSCGEGSPEKAAKRDKIKVSIQCR